jgi:hypothetical protein
MSLGDINRPRYKTADSLRAALLSLVATTLGDDFLELVDGTAPSEQRLDKAFWLTPTEEEAGGREKLAAVLRELEKTLAELGMRGSVYVASDALLLDRRAGIRARLYGGEAGAGSD